MDNEYYKKKKSYYIKECLAKEENRPNGMAGHLAYALIKGREFDAMYQVGLSKRKN